jgi:hypothetical protein
LSLGTNGSIDITRTAAHATQGAAVAAAVDAASATAINSDDDREGLLMVTQARLGSCLTTDAAERARAALDKLGIAIITHSDSSNSTGVAMVIVSSSDLEVRVSIVSLRAPVRRRQQNFNRLLFRASFSWNIRVFNLSLQPSLQNGGATSSCMAYGNWVVSAKTWRAAPLAAGATVALVTVIVAAVLDAG